VVASGKEVTIHEAPISAHGFTGSGFTAIDPQTGAGAYLIEGGARGGLLDPDYVALGKAFLAGALGAIAVLGIPVQLLLLISGAVGLALATAVGGVAIGLAAVALGFDPLSLSVLRATAATILCGAILTSGSAIAASVATPIFLVWLASILAIELVLVLVGRKST
jgi:hypothetical protein